MRQSIDEFLFDVANPTIYEPCQFMSSEATVKCMFDSVITLIYSGNSHMDETMDINAFYFDNWFIKCIYLNLESVFALIITLFVILLYFFIRLNESFIGWIVNDDWYNYNQSYYKIVYCYLCIFISLTMIILWIKMIKWIIFESIMFAQEYLNIINGKNNLDTESTIDKKMDLYDDCGIINCIVLYCIGGICSIYIIYQLIYYLDILQIFIIDQFFMIMIVLMHMH